MDQENKVIKAIMGDINKSFDKVENFKVNGDTEGARQELDKLQRKIEEVERQFETAGGDAFTKNVQEAFRTAKAQVQDYINFIDSAKDKLELTDVARNATQNFDLMKNKMNELNQSLNNVVSNPALDDFSRKLNDIKNVDFDISQKAQQFINHFDQMSKSVENLKNDVEQKMGSINFGQIGGNDLNELDNKLNDIIRRVEEAKNRINNEVGDMLSVEKLSTTEVTQKLESFVSDVNRVGQDIQNVSEGIKNNFSGLFDELSNELDKNTIDTLKELSSVLNTLNNNNIEIKNPLSGIIESLEQLSAEKIQQLDSLASSLGSILNIQVDGDGTAHQLFELATSLDILNDAMNGNRGDEINKLANSLTSLMNLDGKSNVFEQLATSVSGLQSITEAVNSFERMKDVFQPQHFESISQQFKDIQQTAENIANTMANVQAPNFNNSNGNGGGAGYSSGSGSQDSRYDQFYAASSQSNFTNFFGNQGLSSIDAIKEVQRELANELWGQRINETRNGGNASDSTNSMLKQNNEVEAILVDLSNSIGDIKKQAINVRNQKDVGEAQKSFVQLETDVQAMGKKFEQLTSGFENLSAAGGSNNSFDEIVLSMVNTGKKFTREFEDALKDLPSKLRDTFKNQILDTGSYAGFDSLVSNYNKNHLEQSLNNADSIGRNFTRSSMRRENSGDLLDDSDFYRSLISGSSKGIKNATNNSSDMLAAMQGFNDISGHYGNFVSSSSIKRRMSAVNNSNKQLSQQHDNLVDSMDSDDHNLMASSALKFLESGKSNIRLNNRISQKLGAAVGNMDGEDASTTLQLLKTMDSQARETGAQVKDITENLIKMLEVKSQVLKGDEKSEFEKQLQTIKDRLKDVNEEMNKVSYARSDAFNDAVNSPLQQSDYKKVDNDAISYLTNSHSSGYNSIQKQSGAIRRHASAANLANMSGGMLRRFNYAEGNMSKGQLEDIANLSRDMEAEMSKINQLRAEYADIADDPDRQDEAKDKVRALNSHQMKMNNMGQRLANRAKMNQKDLKKAPPEVKQVYDAVQGMLESTKGSNVDLMQLNDLLGLDGLNESLVKANRELDKAKDTKWDRFKEGLSSVKGAINESIVSPLNKVSSMIQGGMGAIGLGSLSALASNPLSLSGLGNIAGKIIGDMAKYYQSQGQEEAGMKSNEMLTYGVGVNGTSYTDDIINKGIDLQRQTNGLIKSEELTGSYNSVVKNIVGSNAGRQSTAQDQADMREFSEVNLSMQKGWGISDTVASGAINTYYKELGKNVKETEYELAKIGQTAQSLNVPFDKMLETVTSMAKQYKSIGFEADYAGNVIGNLMFQHNMTVDDASKMAGNIGNAMTGMPEGWLAYGAGMSGMYADPIQAIVDLQYGFNDDGTQKDGVAEKQAEIFTNNYQMMQGLGGSAGDYGMIKVLNQMGITDKREVAKFLNHADDEDYLTNLFKENAALTEGDTGTEVDEDNPKAYFDGLTEQIAQASEKELDMLSKILNSYEVNQKQLAKDHEEEIDNLLAPLETMMDSFNEMISQSIDWLFNFIESLQKVIKKLDEMMGGNLGKGFEWMMENPIATALIGGGTYLAAKKGGKALWNKVTGKGKSKTNGGGGSGSSSTRTAANTADELEDLANGTARSTSKWAKAKNVAKTGGKWALLGGGAALLGEILLGNANSASASGLDESGTGESGGGFFSNLIGGAKNLFTGAGDAVSGALEGTAGVITVLKDIYNVLVGNGPAGSTSVNGGGSSNNDSISNIAGGVDGDLVMTMAGLGLAGGLTYGTYKNIKNNNTARGTNTATTAEESTRNTSTRTNSGVSDESRARRQQVVDEEAARSRQRVQNSYTVNRASGQTSSEALNNARREETLRNRSSFSRTTQADYEDLFSNYRDPTTRSAKLSTSIKNSLKKSLKPVPLLGSALTLGLSAMEVNDKWNNIDGLAQMTGQDTTREKSRAVSDVATSTALVTAGGALGTLIPIPVVGTALGMGAGMLADWGLEKTGAKDWFADKFGMGSEDIEKSKTSSISKDLQAESKEFQQRMKNKGASINDDLALVAASALDRNKDDLKGLTVDQKDAWASKFTEDYLQRIADGTDPEKAEKLAKEQTDKLLEIQVGQEDMKDLNKEQLSNIIDLYNMSGESKDTLSKYSKDYFKKEGDSKKVLDDTAKKTGLSVDELKSIGKQMGLLPDQLAALIAKTAGGKEEVASYFDNSDEVNGLRKKLEKKGMGTTEIEYAIGGYMENYNALKTNNLSNTERMAWLKAYGESSADSSISDDPLKYANDAVNKYRKTSASWNDGGLYDGFKKTLSDRTWQQYYRETSMPSGMSSSKVVSNFAKTAGLSSSALTDLMKDAGVNKDQFAKYLLGHDSDGKFDSKDVKDLMGKSADYQEIQIDKLDKAYEQAEKQQEDSVKFLSEQFGTTEDTLTTNHEDGKDYSGNLQDQNQKFTGELQDANQEFSDKLQEAKKKADKENTTSVVDALDALGSIIGTKLDGLATSLASMASGLGGSGGDMGGDYLSQVAQLITKGEGDYASVNRNDNGALSIGKFQWHGNRARDLLKDIKSADPETYAKYTSGLGLKSLSSDWSNYTLTQEQAMGLSNLLGTSVGQSEQDDLMKQDVQGYINKGKELGISDPKALAYFADLYNQSPAQAIAIAKASNGSLDSLYKASMSNSVMSKYASRREDAYEAAKGITSSSGDAGGDSVASWYLDSYNITSGFGSQESFRSSSHKGVDLDGQLGDPIKAILGGVVESIKTSASAKDGSGYGNYVRIKHDDGTYSQYSHLQDVNVKAGQKISSGQLIATMGNTGSVVGADGSHLDLTYYDKSMKNLNPESWLKGLANGDAGGDSVSQAYLDAGGDNVKALTDAVKENTSATKDSTTQQASKGLLTNVSAYDPFSGIHPTNMLDYNKSTFNLYKNLDSKGISYNDQGVDMQAYSKAARKQFDINLKTSVDPSQHPNFTEIMDKHMKVAVANAVKEATSDIEGNFTSQFSELWSTAASQVEKAKDY